MREKKVRNNITKTRRDKCVIVVKETFLSTKENFVQFFSREMNS
jgi:hypothetical protein